jgi:hypothetical protein
MSQRDPFRNLKCHLLKIDLYTVFMFLPRSPKWSPIFIYLYFAFVLSLFISEFRKRTSFCRINQAPVTLSVFCSSLLSSPRRCKYTNKEAQILKRQLTASGLICWLFLVTLSPFLIEPFHDVYFWNTFVTKKAESCTTFVKSNSHSDSLFFLNLFWLHLKFIVNS